MQKYTVKKHFSWGSLRLEPGQILIVEPHNEERLLVRVDGPGEDHIFVTPKALAALVKIQSIEAY